MSCIGQIFKLGGALKRQKTKALDQEDGAKDTSKESKKRNLHRHWL